MRARELLERAIRPEAPDAALPRPGLYHFSREVDGHVVRYHLRVGRDGAGVLLANASAVTRLSPSGTVLALGILRGDEDGAARRVRRAFRGANGERVRRDLDTMRAVLDEMVTDRGRFPLRSLDDPESSLHRRTLSAPLAADVVVGDPARTEAILRRLWDAGIPQVVLELPAGGVTTFLPRFVEHAEDLGLVAGVRARATDLVGSGLLDDLAMAGLDHLDLPWAGPDEHAHDGLFGDGDLGRARDLVARCHDVELCPVAVTPITTSLLLGLDETAADLAARRIGAWTVFAVAEAGGGGGQVLGARELRQAAATCEELADRHDLNLVWAPPVEWDESSTVAAQALRGPRTSSAGAVRIEPDGSVIPPVGPRRPAGNLLRDAWNAVWAHPAFTDWRESVDAPGRCDGCPELAACSAGCPTDPVTWARVATGGER